VGGGEEGVVVARTSSGDELISDPEYVFLDQITKKNHRIVISLESPPRPIHPVRDSRSLSSKSNQIQT
jgi:hypothetical protein